MLKQIDEIYEVDTEGEAETLIAEAKAAFDVTRSTITYKFRKKDQHEFYIVTIRKNFVEAEY
jgi:hypothetical protein